jgi:hypothetical protein
MTVARDREKQLAAPSSTEDPEHHEAVLAAEAEAGIALAGTPGADGRATGRDPHAESRRLHRLSEGVRSLRVGGGTLKLSERVLLVLGGILVPLGLIAVLVGWYGAAHTPNLFEQVPYLISGGLFGLGLVFLGSFLYFAHWMTELVKEHRSQSAAVIDAISHLEEVVARVAGSPSGNGAPVAATAAAVADDVALVATEKGTMAHRPECVVVAGKSGVRAVSATDGLLPCKLCDPYGALTN